MLLVNPILLVCQASAMNSDMQTIEVFYLSKQKRNNLNNDNLKSETLGLMYKTTTSKNCLKYI